MENYRNNEQIETANRTETHLSAEFDASKRRLSDFGATAIKVLILKSRSNKEGGQIDERKARLMSGASDTLSGQSALRRVTAQLKMVPSHEGDFVERYEAECEEKKNKRARILKKGYTIIE